MRKSLWLLIAVLSLILFTCKSSDNPVNDDVTKLTKETFTNNVTNQEKLLNNAYSSLSLGNDTNSVLDQIVSDLKADPSVEDAWKSNKMVWVKYKNKMIGNIVIEFDEKEGKPLDFSRTDKKPVNDKPLWVPISHKGLFYDAHYEERYKYTDHLYGCMKDSLTQVGYSVELKTSLDKDKPDLDDLKHLDDYGIVHIYSHGSAYKDNTNIQEVYLLS